jgi:hypothetical protein
MDDSNAETPHGQQGKIYQKQNAGFDGKTESGRENEFVAPQEHKGIEKTDKESSQFLERAA